MAIKIISDSTCDLGEDILKKYDIELVPLHIVMNEIEYRDRIDIDGDKIFAWVEQNDTTPKTSAVSFLDCQEAIKRVVDNGDEAICFTISSKLSTTYNIFNMVVKDLDCQDRVSVVDSLSLSNGIGLLALITATFIKQGKNRQEIVAEILKIRGRLSTTFIVSTFDYLQKGGRCPALVAKAGTALKMHTGLSLKDGEIKVANIYRGDISSSIMKYVKEKQDALLTADKSVAFICTSTDMKEIGMVKEYLESLHHFDEIIISRAGGVICSHCGPDTLGVLFVEGEDEN